MGEPISIDDAEQHLFGLVLMNDWSGKIGVHKPAWIWPHFLFTFHTVLIIVNADWRLNHEDLMRTINVSEIGNHAHLSKEFLE